MLAYMIQRGMPLTREQWISLMWPDGPPKPWCIEHEMEVPEFWQRPELVEAEEEEEFGAQTPACPSHFWGRNFPPRISRLGLVLWIARNRR